MPLEKKVHGSSALNAKTAYGMPSVETRIKREKMTLYRSISNTGCKIAQK
jgi:hypothetical protein